MKMDAPKKVARSSRPSPATVRIVAMVLVFTLFIGFFALFCLFGKKQKLSVSERRLLDSFPTLTADRLFSGRFFEDFNDYASDQFPFRDDFRRLKAVERFYLYGRVQNNDIYFANGRAVKIETVLRENTVVNHVKDWTTRIVSRFPAAARYYAVIPDKNYFVSSLTPHWDYDAFLSLVHANAPENAVYIDLFSLLSLEDYYRTDIHWRQELILPVAGAIAAAMNASIDGKGAYTERSYGNFYGVYYGYSALPLSPEPLNALESEVTRRAWVRSFRFAEDGSIVLSEGGIYTPVSEAAEDPYSLFLGGPVPLLEITDPAAESDKTLVIVRDSFSSSLAPLLLSGYRRVILVDLRYGGDFLLDQLDPDGFEDADLLFLMTTTTLNSLP